MRKIGKDFSNQNLSNLLGFKVDPKNLLDSESPVGSLIDSESLRTVDSLTKTAQI